MKFKHVITLSLALLATACVGTQNVSYDTQPHEIPGVNRTVQYDLDDDFFALAPNCVTVMPIISKAGTYSATHNMVEEAIARHLGDHVTNVVNPFERNAITRDMAVDLTHPTDRKAYARNTKCKYFLELTPISQGNTYLVFWSQSTLGLEARLTDALGDVTLWKARHVATRSDGGLPLSPVAAAYSAFSASVLTNDTDVPYSLADDLARRLTATLPDVRQAGQIAIYN